MQWLLAAMGVVAFGLTFFYLPETIHVKGIDKILASKVDAKSGQQKRWMWVWLNPLRPLGLLRYPNVLAIVSVFLVVQIGLWLTMHILAELQLLVGAPYDVLPAGTVDVHSRSPIWD
jgi:hypothetical protein